MKLGILGSGKIVQAVLPLLGGMPLESVSILGRKKSEEKVRRLAAAYQVDKCYFDYREMLADDIDAVYIALPNHLHFEYAKKALQHHKHVIVEKPAVPLVEELEELEKLSRESGCMCFEAMSLHYLPAFIQLKEDIKKIGPMESVSLQYCQYSSRYDAFCRGKIAPVFDPMQCGGALMDLNVYNLHAILGIFGEPRKVCYEAQMERGIDIGGTLLLDYPGFLASAAASKSHDGHTPCLFQGKKGTISIYGSVNGMNGYVMSLCDGEEKRVQTDNPPHRLTYEFTEIFRALENNNWGLCTEMMGISKMAVQVLEAARKDAGILFPCDSGY